MIPPIELGRVLRPKVRLRLRYKLGSTTVDSVFSGEFFDAFCGLVRGIVVGRLRAASGIEPLWENQLVCASRCGHRDLGYRVRLGKWSWNAKSYS